ncbi:hypothetical protein IF1G_05613 [Cordyceps javanica]|uniref:Uncharacterized protein n=1 Tax=Cordyceps javanica TaxID=43265 RepID=A0A545V241_9HYPO|nr:hypothetical protein IF1G_05613 [Cordyceps javanica]
MEPSGWYRMSALIRCKRGASQLAEPDISWRKISIGFAPCSLAKRRRVSGAEPLLAQRRIQQPLFVQSCWQLPNRQISYRQAKRKPGNAPGLLATQPAAPSGIKYLELIAASTVKLVDCNTQTTRVLLSNFLYLHNRGYPEMARVWLLQ